MARRALDKANQKVPPKNTNETSIHFLVLVATALCASPALPQKSDYSVTFGANGISAPKISLTDWTGGQRG